MKLNEEDCGMDLSGTG